MNSESAEIVFRKDKEWSQIDGELCLVSDFSPLLGSAVKSGIVVSTEKFLPYASISLKCHKISSQITGFITHKMEFANLWAAFKDRGVDEQKEEVLIYWTRRHYKYRLVKILSSVQVALLGATAFPKLIVMICPKGTYESVSGDFPLVKERVHVYIFGLLAIKYWIPDIME